MALNAALSVAGACKPVFTAVSPVFHIDSLHSSSHAGVNAARSTAVFGYINIRSLLSKFDELVELCHDRRIDLLCLTESCMILTAQS